MVSFIIVVYDVNIYIYIYTYIAIKFIDSKLTYKFKAEVSSKSYPLTL